MSATIRKYQPNRTDILINRDWGPRQADLSEDAASRLDMVPVPMLEGPNEEVRWATKREQAVLKKQAFTYTYIRAYGVLLILLGLAAGVVVAVLYGQWDVGHHLALYAAIFGPLYFFTGLGLFFYRRVTWLLLKFMTVTHLAACVLDLMYGTDLPVRAYLMLSLALSTPVRVTFFFVLPAMILLLSKTARCIFVGPLPSGEVNTHDLQPMHPVIHTLIQALTLPGLLFTVIDAFSHKLDWSVANALNSLVSGIREALPFIKRLGNPARRFLEMFRDLFR